MLGGYYSRDPIIWRQLKDSAFTSQQHAANNIFFQILKKEFFSTQVYLLLDSQTGVAMIADAVIANRQDLSSRLNLSNSLTDGDFLFRAYLQWGIDCVHQVIGEFAFAVWEPATQHLTLVSDPVGHRCLFYAIPSGNAFCFANLAKLLIDQGVSRRFNNNKIADYLTFLPSDSQETFFSDIKRVPGGHYLIYDSVKHHVTINKYWDAEKIVQERDQFSSLAAYYDGFRECFYQVIKERLASIATPLACHLSGGLDSSSVASVAADILQKQNASIFALCHLPMKDNHQQPKTGWNYDDAYYMEQVSTKFNNVIRHAISDEDKLFFDANAQLYPYLESPFLNPANLVWLMQFIEYAQQLRVQTVLTGQAGNFTISWKGQSLPITSPWTSLRQTLFKYILGQRYRQPWRYFSAIHPDLAANVNLYDRYIHITEHDCDGRLLVFGQGLFSQAAGFYAAIRHQFGVDHWDPTADKRIVEFCLRAPDEVFKQGQRSRLLVREGLKDVLPKPIAQRTTHGLQAADWYKKITKQQASLHELLLSWRGKEVNHYIDVDYLLRLLNQWCEKRVRASRGRRYSYYEMQYKFKLLRAIDVGMFIQLHSS